MKLPPASGLAMGALSLALLSLGINIFLLSRLRAAEAMVAPMLPWIEQIAVDDGVLRTEVRLPAGTPISFDIPIDERVAVSIDTILPINTRITVPLRSPLGSYDIPVPIRANVPLRATIPLRIQHTFQLRSRTSEEIVVPIEVGG